MRLNRRRAVALVVMSNLLGCGGSDSPTAPTGGGGDFPTSRSGCHYYISGLGDHVVDPAAERLEARVTVGELLWVSLLTCGPVSSLGGPFEWTSTRPTILEAHPNRFAPFTAQLGAKQPGGGATLFLDFGADDGRRVRTTLGYCPENDATGHCPSLRKIDVVTVVR